MKPIEWSGEQILKARHRVGLSQKHFAMLLGVSSGSVCGWETDRITPRPIAIEALNKLAEMSPEVVREKSRIQRMSGKLARTLTGELLSQKKRRSLSILHRFLSFRSICLQRVKSLNGMRIGSLAFVLGCASRKNILQKNSTSLFLPSRAGKETGIFLPVSLSKQ